MADLAVKSKSSVQVFENGEFGKLEVIEIDGKPYFPATECAKVLGYANTKDAVLRHCKGVVKHDLPTNGGVQVVNLIPEGDLYRLIIRSQLPSAERFERWVCGEVLPSISPILLTSSAEYATIISADYQTLRIPIVIPRFRG